MKKTSANSNQKEASPRYINRSTNHLGNVYIDDEAQHLAGVAAAQDMLSFLRTSTNHLALHEELHTPPFYRGLSLCIGAVQAQLSEGLMESDEENTSMMT